MPVKSRKQAGLFGIIASGKKTRKKIKMSANKAREMLRGSKLKKLPLRVGKGK